MTDAQVGQQDAYLEYLRKRVNEVGDPRAKRELERAQLRGKERGFVEALTTTASGRDRSFFDLFAFAEGANEAIYLDRVREAREALDKGTASGAQRKLYEHWEDSSYRQSSFGATVADIAAQAPAFMQEMYLGGVATGAVRAGIGAAAKTGLRKTMLGRTAAAVSRPVRRFDAGLSNIIRRSAEAAQKTATPNPFGQVGIAGMAAGLTRAATIGAAEQTVANTVLGEAFGAVYGGGSRYRVQQLNNYLRRNGARDPLTGSLRALDNEFGMWTNAAPALLDLYIEMMSEMSGHALVQFPAAIKLGLTGQGFAKSGTSNRMLSLLGLSPDPADLGRWNRSAFSGLIPEIGEEFVGAATRDAVHAIAPELAEEGNLEYLVDNIGAVSLGLALGMGAPAAMMQTRNRVDPLLAWANFSPGARQAYEGVRDKMEKAEREAVVADIGNVRKFATEGFSSLGSAQIAMGEPLRARWFGSERVREEARGRVIADRDPGDLRPPSDTEIDEEMGAMWGEMLRGQMLSEDGTKSPMLEALLESEVIDESEVGPLLSEIGRRAKAMADALANGDIAELARIHAEDIIGRDAETRDRAGESKSLRVARDRDAAQKIAEEYKRLLDALGQSEEMYDEVFGPTKLEGLRGRVQGLRDRLEGVQTDLRRARSKVARAGARAEARSEFTLDEGALQAGLQQLLDDPDLDQGSKEVLRDSQRIGIVESTLQTLVAELKGLQRDGDFEGSAKIVAVLQAAGASVVSPEVGSSSRSRASLFDTKLSKVELVEDPAQHNTVLEVLSPAVYAFIDGKLVMVQQAVVRRGQYRGDAASAAQLREQDEQRGTNPLDAGLVDLAVDAADLLQGERVTDLTESEERLYAELAAAEDAVAAEEARTAGERASATGRGEARARVEQLATESLLEGVPQRKEAERLRKAVSEVELDTESVYDAQLAIDQRLAELAREAGAAEGAVRVIDYRVSDMPGQRVPNTLGVTVVEVAAEDTKLPAAWFDTEVGVIFADRGRLSVQAQAEGLTPEQLLRRAMTHETGHAAFESIRAEDRMGVMQAWDTFLNEMGIPASRAEERLQRPEYQAMSEEQRLSESLMFRIEELADLLDAKSQQSAELGKQSWFRQFMEGVLQVVLPRTASVRQAAKDMRVQLRDAGYDVESMSDQQVLGYALTADALLDMLLRPEVPMRQLMRPAVEDLEEALAQAPAGFWDRLRGERPLPRPTQQLGAREGIRDILMPSSEGVYGALAAELGETTGVPTTFGEAEGRLEQQRQAVREADAVIIFRDQDDKAAAARVKELKKLAGKKPVKVNPRPKELRKWLEANKVQRPAYISLGVTESAVGARGRESLLGALGGLERMGRFAEATPTFSDIENLGPYGGLTARQVVERWRAGEELPELDTAARLKLPREISEADSVMLVGRDKKQWEAAQKEAESLGLPVLVQPVRWQEIASWMAHKGLNKPYIVGTTKAVTAAEAMWKEAVSPQMTLRSLVVTRQWQMGIDATRESPYDRFNGQFHEVVPRKTVTVGNGEVVDPRGNVLYPETEMYVLPDEVIGTPLEATIQRAKTADLEGLVTIANQLNLRQTRDVLDHMARRQLREFESRQGLPTAPPGVEYRETAPTFRGVRYRGEQVRRKPGKFRGEESRVDVRGPVSPAREQDIDIPIRQAMAERDSLMLNSMRDAVLSELLQRASGRSAELPVQLEERRSDLLKVDHTFFGMPRAMMIPNANARKGSIVLVSDTDFEMQARLVDLDGDVATVEYTESTGTKRTRTTRRSNLYHAQLSLELGGTMPLFGVNGELLSDGALVWRRNVTYGARGVRPGEPRTGQASQVIEPREGETPAAYQERAIEAAYELLEAYPNMEQIAREGRFTPTAEDDSETKQRTQRETQARMTAVGARAGLFNAIASSLSADARVVAPGGVIRIVPGAKGGIRLNYDKREELREMMRQNREGVPAEGEVRTGDAELTSYEREQLDVLDNALNAQFRPINKWIGLWASNKVGMYEIADRIKKLQKRREKNKTDATDEEVALRLFMAGLIDTTAKLEDDVMYRGIALQAGEAFASMGEDDPRLTALLSGDDVGERGADANFFQGIMLAALGARATSRRRLLQISRLGDPEYLKTAAEAAERGGLQPDEEFEGEEGPELEQIAARAFQALASAAPMDVGARQNQLPEVAARALGIAWNLYKDHTDALATGDTDAQLATDQLTVWRNNTDKTFFTRVFEVSALNAVGRDLAPVVARAAVLMPRAVSDDEYLEKEMHSSADIEMRHSPLTMVAQMLQSAGYGPAVKGFRGFVPLVAMSPATPQQLLKLLDLDVNGVQYKRLTQPEIAALAQGRDRFARTEDQAFREASERELMRVLAVGDLLAVEQWFESNTNEELMTEQQAQRAARLAEIDAIKERRLSERDRTGDKTTPVVTPEEMAEAQQLMAEMDESESMRKFRQRLIADKSYDQFVSALKKRNAAVRNGQKNPRERDTVQRAENNFYQDIGKMPMFRSGRLRKVKQVARAVAAVRSARMMLHYDRMSAVSAARIAQQEADSRTSFSQTSLGTLSLALAGTLEAMDQAYGVLDQVETLLQEGRIASAAQVLVQSHMMAQPLQHVAHHQRVARIGTAKGLQFLERQLMAAADGGQEIVIVPRAGVDFYVPLDPTLVVSPTAVQASQMRANPEDPGMASSLSQAFGLVDEYEFSGSASPAGMFRHILKVTERDSILAEVNGRLFGKQAKREQGKKFRKRARRAAQDEEGLIIPDVALELLYEIDESLADRFAQLIEESDRRALSRGMKLTIPERRRLATSALYEALEPLATSGMTFKDVTPKDRRSTLSGVSTLRFADKRDPEQAHFDVSQRLMLVRAEGNRLEYVRVAGFTNLTDIYKDTAKRVYRVVESYMRLEAEMPKDGTPLRWDLANLPQEMRKRILAFGAVAAKDGTLLTGEDLTPFEKIQERPLSRKLAGKRDKGLPKFQGVRPRLGPAEEDYDDAQKKRMQQFRRASKVRVPQMWNADYLPKGGESDFDTGLFLATYDDWHSKTMLSQTKAMRQHRLNRDRLEDWADTQGVRGFAYKKLLRDVGEAMLVRIDLDYWVHSDAGYSRGVDRLSYTKGDDQSLWNALEARAEGRAKYTQRNRDIFKLAKAIRTEPKYAAVRALIADMNEQQSRVTEVGRAADLFKGSIYSYASLGWRTKKGERIYEPNQGSAVGLLEVGAAGGPLREDVGYRRMEKKLVSVLDGWSKGYELVLPNALDASARTARVVYEARYNKAWISGLEAAGIVRAIPENRVKPGYVRLKADVLSGYQAIPWVAKYINNATTHFGLQDIENPILRGFMRMNFAAKHLMLMFGFFHHQAFMRSYLFTVEGTEAAKAMTEDGGVISAAAASVASYARSVGRARRDTMSRLENGFRPMAMGRQAWEQLTPEFELLVRAGLTVQLSNELTQTMGGAYYTPEDVAEIDGWFDKVRERINGFGAGAVAKPMLTMLENVRIAQRETAEWLFNTMGANMKIAAALIKYRELHAKALPEQQQDDEYKFEIARIAAEQVNADFGGLDLRGRSGKLSDYFGEPGPRNPVHQMVLRGLFLAPDWTESNATAFLGMLKRGKRFATPAEVQNIQRAAYRTMWMRVASRAMMLQLALNMALAVTDPDKSLADLYAESGFPGFGDEDAPKAQKLRWLDANISRMSPTESRKFLSVWGHFMDPLKWTVEAVDEGFLAPIERKGSSAMRGLYEMVSGANWAGRRYNTLQDFYNWDPEYYQYRVVDEDGTVHMPGEEKRGRYEGMMTRPSSRTGHVRTDELPLWAFDQSMKFVPLQVRALIDYVMGSHDALDAMAQMVGAKMSRTYPDPD